MNENDEKIASLYEDARSLANIAVWSPGRAIAARPLT